MTAPDDAAGHVVLVGAGPGPAGLLTAEGAKWLSRAKCVLYDRLVGRDVVQLAPASAERIPVGKRPGGQSVPQERINELLIEKARAGGVVVRLKGGDPFIFGRGGEEAEALAAAGVPYRIVPGVTAAVAAAAHAGIPLTHRRIASTVAFVTGHEDPDKADSSLDFRALARIDTLAFYMGVGALRATADRLMAAGRAGDTPTALVENATSPRQRVVTATLATAADVAEREDVRPPAIVLVGQVAALHGRLAWVGRLPLSGRTVLVTRARAQASRLAERLGELGAQVIEAPTIEIQPPASFDTLDSELRRVGERDWIVLTSPNGAVAVFDRLAALGFDARALGRVRVAAVGPATAEALAQRSIRADLVPETHTTEALTDALLAAARPGARVLLARSDLAPADMAERLTGAGMEVEDVTAYRTVRPHRLPDEALQALRAGEADWITFTSSSTVENFFALAPNTDLSAVKAAAIGPVTADTLRARGVEPAVTVDPHTIDALVEGIAAAETAR